MESAAQRTAALLAAAEAGARLRPKLAGLTLESDSLMFASMLVAMHALNHFAALQTALLEQLQHGGGGAFGDAAAERALRTLIGLQGTLLKLLEQQGCEAPAYEEAMALHSAVGALNALPVVLAGSNMRPGVQLSTAR